MIKDAVKSICYAVPVLTVVYLFCTGAVFADYVSAIVWFIDPLLTVRVK